MILYLGPCEVPPEDSSESDLFVPSDDDCESDLDVDWSTRLRSWCANEGATCREINTLSCQFIENFEKFKANKLAKESRAAKHEKLSRWQEFLEKGFWREMTEYSLSSSLCSESDSEVDSKCTLENSQMIVSKVLFSTSIDARDLSSQRSSYMESSNFERHVTPRQLHNSSGLQIELKF